MTDPLTPAALARLIDQRPPRLGRTRLVAVDGPAGSGKTTLAGAIAGELAGTAVVHMDDLYLGWDTDFAEVHDRIRDQLVTPLSDGRAARYQRYDWHAGRLRDWVDVPVPPVLVLEGVASGARDLDDVRSLLVWIEAPEQLRIRRGVERDGPAVLPQWLTWMQHEATEHARQDTRARADIRLLGVDPSGRLPHVP